MSTLAQRRKSRALWLPILVAVLADAAMALCFFLVRDQLPDKIAVHWGIDGRPNRWSSPVSSLVWMVGLTALLLGMVIGLGMATKQRTITGCLGAGMAVFLALVAGGGALMQHPKSPVTSIDMLIPGALLVSMLVALLVVPLLKQSPSTVLAVLPVPPEAPRLEVPAQARVAWTGRTRLGGGGKVAFLLAMALFAAGGLYVVLAYRQWGMGLYALILVFAFVVLWAFTLPRITISGDGVRARSLGLTSMYIPLAQIEYGSVVAHIDPMTDFGGWGYRFAADGEGGYVTARGPALRIHRALEPDFLITLEGAEDACRALNTLVLRRGLAGQPD